MGDGNHCVLLRCEWQAETWAVLGIRITRAFIRSLTHALTQHVLIEHCDVAGSVHHGIWSLALFLHILMQRKGLPEQ